MTYPCEAFIYSFKSVYIVQDLPKYLINISNIQLIKISCVYKYSLLYVIIVS
jgi:hypothetical protein